MTDWNSPNLEWVERPILGMSYLDIPLPALAPRTTRSPAADAKDDEATATQMALLAAHDALAEAQRRSAPFWSPAVVSDDGETPADGEATSTIELTVHVRRSAEGVELVGPTPTIDEVALAATRVRALVAAAPTEPGSEATLTEVDGLIAQEWAPVLLWWGSPADVDLTTPARCDHLGFVPVPPPGPPPLRGAHGALLTGTNPAEITSVAVTATLDDPGWTGPRPASVPSETASIIVRMVLTVTPSAGTTITLVTRDHPADPHAPT